jgi:hypothetical protein
MIEKIIKTIPKLPQRQDGALDQLEDLRVVANRLGMYDAADLIRIWIENNNTKGNMPLSKTHRAIDNLRSVAERLGALNADDLIGMIAENDCSKGVNNANPSKILSASESLAVQEVDGFISSAKKASDLFSIIEKASKDGSKEEVAILCREGGKLLSRFFK